MTKNQSKQAAQQAIAKAKQSPAGWWSVSFDRKGRPVQMFVPANSETPTESAT